MKFPQIGRYLIPTSDRFYYFLRIAVALQVAGFLGHVLFFATNHYLAGPFIYDKKDTFMDFYHTAYWSLNSGRFTEWGSVYPPLVFVALRALIFISSGEPAVYDGFSLRHAWPEAQLWLVLLYASCVYASVEYPLRRIFPARERLLLAVFVLLSPPVLFALERGNLIILLCPLVAMMLSPNKWLRCLAIALMINIKPYTVLFAFFFVFRQDIHGLIRVIIFSFVIFAVSGLILDQNFPIFLINLVSFADTQFHWLPAGLESMDSTVNVLDYNAQYRYLFRDSDFSIKPDMLLLAALPKYINFIIIFVSVCVLYIRRSTLTDTQIFFVITSIITNYAVSTGGYVLVMYIPFLALLLSNEEGGKTQIFFLIFALFLPSDWIIYRYSSANMYYIYLSDSYQPVNDIRGIGTFLRPVFNLLGLYLISLHFLRLTNQPKLRAHLLPQL